MAPEPLTVISPQEESPEVKCFGWVNQSDRITGTVGANNYD
ncbi:MAG: hypothetical protein AAFY11_05390 [Cyanobacteria bacterium J06641_5]